MITENEGYKKSKSESGKKKERWQDGRKETNMLTRKKGKNNRSFQGRWKTLKEPINKQTSQTETNKDRRKDKYKSPETE
jgi:hypothetical protein